MCNACDYSSLHYTANGVYVSCLACKLVQPPKVLHNVASARICEGYDSRFMCLCSVTELAATYMYLWAVLKVKRYNVGYVSSGFRISFGRYGIVCVSQ